MDWFRICFGVTLDLFCSHFGLVSDLWGVILTGVGLILKLLWTVLDYFWTSVEVILEWF